MLAGGCFCGAIRYEAAGPASSHALCHCEMCRRGLNNMCPDYEAFGIDIPDEEAESIRTVEDAVGYIKKAKEV